MNNKKYQIFVSSTYKDLIEERQAVVQAILELHHIPAGMELFNGGKSQWETITKWIDSSDIYLLILGGRYGSLDPEKKYSYTELEYRYAIDRKIPAFTIVLEDEYIEKKRRECVDNKGQEEDIIEKENKIKYDKFKEFVINNTVVKYVKNIDSIPGKVAVEISDKEKNNNLVGWSRGNRNNIELLEKIEKLREDKEGLLKQISNSEVKKTESIIDFKELKEKLNDELEKILYYDEYDEYENDTYKKGRVIFLGPLNSQQVRKMLESLENIIAENVWHPSINARKFWKSIGIDTVNLDIIEMSSVEELNNIYLKIKEEYNESYMIALENYIAEMTERVSAFPF